MEARSVDRIPVGDQWQYEPKWDAFRCLLARDGEKLTMTRPRAPRRSGAVVRSMIIGGGPQYSGHPTKKSEGDVMT
jgi:hypothetical protein